jgi:hypothetical protein
VAKRVEMLIKLVRYITGLNIGGKEQVEMLIKLVVHA